MSVIRQKAEIWILSTTYVVRTDTLNGCCRYRYMNWCSFWCAQRASATQTNCTTRCATCSRVAWQYTGLLHNKFVNGLATTHELANCTTCSLAARPELNTSTSKDVGIERATNGHGLFAHEQPMHNMLTSLASNELVVQLVHWWQCTRRAGCFSTCPQMAMVEPPTDLYSQSMILHNKLYRGVWLFDRSKLYVNL